ncbi:MAG TPA: cation-translocating P-type ATPase [Candidatus Limnocylindria bacterium]|nr:cation-translocating P-type ATPase [Candidatus Limnocylindria bacterium]
MGHDHASAAELPWRPMMARAGVCTVGAVTGWWLHPHWNAPAHVAFTIAYVSGAWDLALAVWEDLRRLRFNTQFLMLLVAAGAAAIGAWNEGALLLILFSWSAAMETFAAGRTRREIGALLKGAPKTARLLDGEREREVTVESLKPGDLIRVTAGEQMPVDFEITLGRSAGDESTLTGESEPVPKNPGDTAFAGTLNLWGVVEGRVLRAAGDSALQRIIRLIHDAQQQKAPIQRFTDRFGTGYTLLVVTACVAMFLVNWLVAGAPPFVSTGVRASAIYRAMTLLVVLSPCALVLSVPSAILSAIACGARHGVLFRGGSAVEMLAEVRVVAMDKTGTLTEGAMHLVGLEVLRGTEADVLAAAGSLAKISNHPVSRAIAREATQRGARLDPVEATETIPGKGVSGHWRGQTIALGNRELMADRGVAAAELASLAAVVDANETWLAGDGLLGRLQLRDTLRPESRQLVTRLQADGLRIVMLTGDRANAAKRMAEEAGVAEVRSQLKPEHKVAAVQELKAGGTLRVAMIGDGVNDAPVLAAADVGVAMGARGSDAALEQADVVLMNDRLENFVFARDLSRRARSIIRQNLVLSLGTMMVMATLSLVSAKIPLSLGVAAHEGSTVIVVLNSLRLLFPPAPRKTPAA